MPHRPNTTSESTSPTHALDTGLWQDDECLVMRIRDAKLPALCVKCGEAAEPPNLVCRVFARIPADRLLFALLLSGFTLPLILYVFGESARISVPLCDTHREHALRSRRRIARWFFSGVVIAIGPIVATVFLSMLSVGWMWLIVSIVSGLMIGLPIVLLSSLRWVLRQEPLSAFKIHRGFIWLDDIPYEILEGLPEIPE